MNFGSFCLQRGRLGLKQFGLGLRLAFRSVTFRLGFLKTCLDLEVELIDILLKLCFPVGVSFCLLCL